MARHTADAYDLTDAEKRDLIKLIEQGKPLPEKYRFLLFADKREVELVWNGKSREVCTAILPFQTLEHIDEPRKEKRDDEELGLDTGGRQVKGWTNKLIWGDNKLILASLKSGALRRQIEDAGGLKLIYIDPPFSRPPTERRYSPPPPRWARTSAWTSRLAARPSTRSRTSSNKSPTATPGGAARIPSSP